MLIRPTAEAHWRDSARIPKFWLFDANAAFPFLLFLIHIRWWTFIVATIFMIFFTVLNRYGFSVPVFLRWLRALLAGKRRVAIPWWTS